MEEFSFTNNKNSFFDGGNPLLPTPNWGDNIRCNLKMTFSREERELPGYYCFFAGTLSRLTVRMHEEDNDRRSKCQLAAFFFLSSSTKKQANDLLSANDELSFVDFWGRFSSLIENRDRWMRSQALQCYPRAREVVSTLASYIV